MNCANESRATSRWKKCPDFEMKSAKPDKSTISAKHKPKTHAHKSDNRHNLDKCQPLFKGHRYECYTRLTANHATILKEEFNLERSLPPITFTDKDFKGINTVNQDDLVVVSIIIENFMVSRVLIDQGSYANILYWKTF
ncbi:hypothetical protein JHK86_055611 [Glycine max]|nr:hypothetical protein JHK86_055611 [Glycine max]